MAEVDTITIPDSSSVVQTVATTSKLIKSIGLPTDAADSHTDATSITHTQILKQHTVDHAAILAAVQALRSAHNLDDIVAALSGIASASNQSTGNTSLASILTGVNALRSAHNIDDIVAALSGIATAANQSTGNTSLASILTGVNALRSAHNIDDIVAAIVTTNSDLASIHTDTGTTLSADLSTLHTDLATTLHADLATTIAGILGITSGAAVTTDANGTLQQYLRGLVKALGSLTNTTNALDVNIKSGLVSPGQAAMAASTPSTIANDQKWQTGMSPRAFSAAFSTLTRQANVTAYTALDSISDNATAASVTALSATLSDTNDDPLTITEILLASTDTGLAGKRVRAYLFNSDPTASSGVGAGDNVAYSNKKAGYIGSMSGVMESGFSDGSVGRLVPSYADGAASGTPNAPAGGFIITKPTSGAKTIFIQYQAVDGFTPSANSTTLIGTARGFQGRAA